MKTIEEKAQAYDKALEIARKLQENFNGAILKKCLWSIFPELKESEDEKIRKLLIRLFKSNENEKFDDVSTQEIIAWLEKQHTDPYNGVCFDCYGHKWGVCARDGGVEVLIDKNLKAFVSPDKSFIYPTHNQLAREADEEKEFDNSVINNQKCVKPSHKIRPKFHEGEWISNGEYTWKIVDVKPLEYILQSQDGHIVNDDISYVDAYFHHWTIQDAKDGDVLVTMKKQPFIFNGHYDEDTDYIYGYCGICDLVKDNSFYVNEESVEEECKVWCVNENVYPATKDQHDSLMIAMTDAGYFFDFKKKELKKLG